MCVCLCVRSHACVPICLELVATVWFACLAFIFFLFLCFSLILTFTLSLFVGGFCYLDLEAVCLFIYFLPFPSSQGKQVIVTTVRKHSKLISVILLLRRRYAFKLSLFPHLCVERKEIRVTPREEHFTLYFYVSLLLLAHWDLLQ